MLEITNDLLEDVITITEETTTALILVAAEEITEDEIPEITEMVEIMIEMIIITRLDLNELTEPSFHLQTIITRDHKVAADRDATGVEDLMVDDTTIAAR